MRENDLLRAKLAESESKLAEAQELIQAIQQGEVDAVVVSGPEGDQVFTLKHAEYAYRALVEAMNEGAATLAADGTIVYCNQRLSHLLGVPLEQIIGKPVTNLVKNESAHALEAVVAQARRGEPVANGLELESVNGRRIPVQVSLRQMTSVDPIAYCMVVTDLTERKAREELISAGKLAETILQSAAEAIAVCDQSGYIIVCNKAFKDLTGGNPILRPFDEAMPLEFISNSEVPEKRAVAAEALRGATFAGQRALLRRKDGRVVPLLISASPMGSSKWITGCVFTLTNITERERFVQALRKSEERFRAMVMASSNSVYRMSADWSVMRIVAGRDSVAGTEEPDANWTQKYVHPDDQEQVRAVIHEAIRTKGIFELEHRGRTTDGGMGWVFSRAIPLLDANGEIVEWFGAASDVTERKRAEEALLEGERQAIQRQQLRALAGRLQKAREEERTRVARDLHDDIGQILTAVKMDLVWIGRHTPEQEAEVRERLKGALKLIGDGVGSVRKICAGLRPSILDDLGLGAAIEWQAKDFASRTGIACRVSLPDKELALPGDHATAIFRIFQECLTNVARHAGAESVRASLFSQAEDLVLTVEDDGRGFDESKAASSLGILGMKERAQGCGGELAIASSAGKGTTVTVRVPMHVPGGNGEDR